VSLSLRETQLRILQFTADIQHYGRSGLPWSKIIIAHIMKSMVFVMIMIGVLFCVAALLEDKVMALILLTLVWICEFFAVICLRSRLSIIYFPRFFFLYFFFFLIYYFSFPFGFSYVAFFTTVELLQHAMLHFINHYEIPALQSGAVSATNPRQILFGRTLVVHTLHQLAMQNGNIGQQPQNAQTQTQGQTQQQSTQTQVVPRIVNNVQISNFPVVDQSMDIPDPFGMPFPQTSSTLHFRGQRQPNEIDNANQNST